MIVRWLSVFIVIMVLFGGCAKTNEEYNALRNNKLNAPKTFSTLSERELVNEEELIIELGDKDNEVVILDKQRVFASKLRIPKMNKPFRIDILSSSAIGFFAPKILFLNKKDKILRITKAKDLQFDRGLFKGTVFVNNNYEKIHSLVVTQDLQELHSKHKMSYVSSTPILIPVGPYMMTYISSTGDQNKTIKNSYGGNVRLKLKVYNPTKIGDNP